MSCLERLMSIIIYSILSSGTLKNYLSLTLYSIWISFFCRLSDRDLVVSFQWIDICPNTYFKPSIISTLIWKAIFIIPEVTIHTGVISQHSVCSFDLNLFLYHYSSILVTLSLFVRGLNVLLWFPLKYVILHWLLLLNLILNVNFYIYGIIVRLCFLLFGIWYFLCLLAKDLYFPFREEHPKFSIYLLYHTS